jgi:putative ABC transport system permease protein
MQEELASLAAMADPRELGYLTLAAEDARAEWSLPGLDRIVRDIRMALRMLRRSPGYTFACVAILALGIGANTAIFSVVYAAALKPLPYPNTNRLVFVWDKIPSLPEPVGPRMPVQRIAYEEWQRQRDIFGDMAAYQEGPLNEAGVERPRTLSTGYAAANLLPLLGARAAVGRLFRREEDQPGKDLVVVLSDAYFDTRFHRDLSAIGTSLTLGRTSYTVIGVLPRQFHLPATYGGDDQKKPDVWVPLSRRWSRPAADTAFQLYVIGLLNPGVSLEQARAAMSLIQTRLNTSDPERYPLSQASVFPVTAEDRSDDVNLALYVLLGAVGVLLLIGCANLANLTLARATRRAREISIRRALGASRGQIVGQLVTESVLISVTGAGIGVLLARLTMDSLLKFHVPVPRPEEIDLNWAVFAFAAAVSQLTILLFGFGPAVAAANVNVNEGLKSRGGGASTKIARGRQTLTGVEVGLAVILLCSAGLLLRSFVTLSHTGLGFRTAQLAVVDIDLPEDRYPDAGSRARFYDALLSRASAIPGVATASASTTLPMKGVTFETFAFAGRPRPKMNETLSADIARVGGEYFRLMELPMLAGRSFTPADVARNASGKRDGVVIVNRAFVATFFKNQSPLGQRLLLQDSRPFEIIGVAADFLAMGALSDARPQLFVAGIDAPKGLLLLRTTVPPGSLFDDIRATLLSMDAELPVGRISNMEETLHDAFADQRSLVVLMSAFAGLALLLAMFGIYAVLASLVASRTREIGIHMALGASPGAIGWMVTAQSLKPLVTGLVFGLGGSFAVSRVIVSLLIGIAPGDPATFLFVTVAVMVAVLVALWAPVRRATRVECTVALRED